MPDLIDVGDVWLTCALPVELHDHLFASLVCIGLHARESRLNRDWAWLLPLLRLKYIKGIANYSPFALDALSSHWLRPKSMDPCVHSYYVILSLLFYHMPAACGIMCWVCCALLHRGFWIPRDSKYYEVMSSSVPPATLDRCAFPVVEWKMSKGIWMLMQCMMNLIFTLAWLCIYTALLLVWTDRLCSCMNHIHFTDNTHDCQCTRQDRNA